VKDYQTHAVLLEGRSENGLYPLRLQRSSLRDHHSFTAFLGIKTSLMGWHFRLGHPSFDVVSRIVKKFHLPLSFKNTNKDVICSSCQLGKSKRQPFSSSNRVSTHPLQLIHTYVWTSPISFVSGYKYYVIFIDDFSRFSWLYPLYAKSKIFDHFVNLNSWLRINFLPPLNNYSLMEVESIILSNFNHFCTNMGLFTESLVHTHLNKMDLQKEN
jgi:hypothetical protein